MEIFDKRLANTWRTIVFDFDGTLARLNIDFALMRASVLDLPLCRAVPEEVTGSLYTLEMIEAAGAYLGRRSPEDAARFLEGAHGVIGTIEMEAARQGELFPRTRELLSELRRRSIKTGVITRNCRKAVLQVFPDIDLCVDATITRDDSRNVKPHPGHLYEIMQLLGEKAEESAMVGDHPLDILTAKNAGCCAIGVLTGSSPREVLAEAGADLVLPDSYAITGYV
jgi:phosphoglycolate phosphatase